MTDGHCDHCQGPGVCDPRRHIDRLPSIWRDGECPVCDMVEDAAATERARIVAWLRGKTATVVFIQDTADAIEQGRHVGDSI